MQTTNPDRLVTPTTRGWTAWKPGITAVSYRGGADEATLAQMGPSAPTIDEVLS